jgi:hypothetical protein
MIFWDQTGIDSTVLVEELFNEDNESVNHRPIMSPFHQKPLSGVKCSFFFLNASPQFNLPQRTSL